MRANLKKLLRFYYSAEGVNEALDGVILRLAISSWRDAYGVEHSFEEISRVLEVKAELTSLWAELNAVISAMTEIDGRSLEAYANLRTGIGALEEGERRELHRALVKFKRRLGTLAERRSEAVKLAALLARLK